jgi:molybdate transport system substrate-binding protein
VKSKIMKARSIGMVPATVALATFMIGVVLLPAHMRAQMPAQKTGAELRVLSSDGMEPAMRDLTPRIERTIGRKLKSQFDSSKNLVDKIQAGEGFDVAILTTATIDDLIKQGKIVSGSRVEIASAGLGVGVRKGAAKPDISTPEAMKQTLLNVKSITFNSTGATAAVITKMFDRLGIADQVKGKLKPDPVSGVAQKMVADGKVELLLILIPEVTRFPGVVYVGPFPGNLQSTIYFAAGVAANAHDAEKAKALVSFLGSPAAVPTLKAKGMVPH